MADLTFPVNSETGAAAGEATKVIIDLRPGACMVHVNAGDGSHQGRPLSDYPDLQAALKQVVSDDLKRRGGTQTPTQVGNEIAKRIQAIADAKAAEEAAKETPPEPPA